MERARPVKPRRRGPGRAERERRRALATARHDARDARGAEQRAARAARRQERSRRRRARSAARRARILRILVLIETGARRFARIIVPAHTRRLPRATAVLVLVLNIAPLPGLGTGIYGKWERGIVQFLLTFVFLLGWLWALADGIRIVSKAFARDDGHGENPQAARTREA